MGMQSQVGERWNEMQVQVSLVFQSQTVAEQRLAQESNDHPAAEAVQREALACKEVDALR